MPPPRSRSLPGLCRPYKHPTNKHQHTAPAPQAIESCVVSHAQLRQMRACNCVKDNVQYLKGCTSGMSLSPDEPVFCLSHSMQRKTSEQVFLQRQGRAEPMLHMSQAYWSAHALLLRVKDKLVMPAHKVTSQSVSVSRHMPGVCDEAGWGSRLNVKPSWRGDISKAACDPGSS